MLSFKELIILCPTKTEDRVGDDRPGGLFVALSCFVSSSAGLLAPSPLFSSVCCHDTLPSLASTARKAAAAAGLGDKSRRRRGVPGKPKARRRSTGLLKKGCYHLGSMLSESLQ